MPAGLENVSYRTLTATDGTEVEADVVIWGTGFHVTDSLAGIDFTGENGLPLSEAWQEGLQAHLGTATTGFPNLFFLLGPHTGLGHNSVVLMIEAQVAHVCKVLQGMRDQDIAAVTPAEEKQAAFEAEIETRLNDSVCQAGGCVSWYQDENGRNTTLWPGTVREYQQLMAKSGLEQYRLIAPK